MKVVEHLSQAGRPLISYEIIPPLRGGTLRRLLDLIEDLVAYNPPFIDITSHAAEVVYEESDTGLERKVKRKRPGTLGVCALIQNKYDIDAVPHILCNGFTREETEDALIELRYLGIENVLAVRGDDSGYEKPLVGGRTANVYATDLVAQVAGMNRGKYLQLDLLDADPTDFCIGVGGYPEKHFEAPNLETDVAFAKQKIDAGADYIVTQMFFDNAHFYSYVELCRAAGIEAPIVPGLKIVTAKAHTSSVPANFYVDLPPALSDAVGAAKDNDEALEIGVQWARDQVMDLLEHDVPAIHFYIMQSSKAIKRLMDGLKL
ncbi:MAG: methylenetetrahydrofolate reductase [Acidobacteriota bacterium]|nr:methylenetetrahydrofolate reductase [Acidobacteriota bacterium]